MSEYISTQLSLNTIHGLLRPKGKKNVSVVLSDQEIEQSLLPLFDYLDANVSRTQLSARLNQGSR